MKLTKMNANPLVRVVQTGCTLCQLTKTYVRGKMIWLIIIIRNARYYFLLLSFSITIDDTSFIQFVTFYFVLYFYFSFIYLFLLSFQSYSATIILMNNTCSSEKIRAIALFFLTGTLGYFCTKYFMLIGSKLQGLETVDEGDQKDKNFFHPYMQTWTMMIGQLLCLPIYFYRKKQNQNKQIIIEKLNQAKKQVHQPWIFFIPSIADCLASLMQLMSVNFLPVSTYMLLRGASIITTFIFQKIILKSKTFRRHIVGCLVTFVGVVVIGLSTLVEENSENALDSSKQVLGFFLVVVSLVFNGFQFAYEAYLFQKYEIDPLEMVGFEGVFGVLTLTLVNIILSFVPCNFTPNECVFTDNNQSIIESPIVFFTQIGKNWYLMVLTIGFIMSIAVYNLNGQRIVKLIDALTKAIMMMVKTIFGWFIGLTVSLFIVNKRYQLESLNVAVNLIKMAGFALIVSGSLIYSKLLFAEKLQTDEEKSFVLEKIEDQFETQQTTSKIR